MNKGKTVLKGNLKAIKSTYPANRAEVDVDVDIKNYIQDANLEIEHERNHQYTLKVQDEQNARKLLQKLVEAKINVNRFEILKPTLNDIFIEKVGAANEK